MKLNTQQKKSLLVIIFSLIILVLVNTVGFGKYLSTVLPCTTRPQDSIDCYVSYDMIIFLVLVFIIAICVVGLSIDFIRSIAKRK